MNMEDKIQFFPEKFFAIPNPTEPWVSIQFRTTIQKGSIHKAEQWEEITLNPSNHFDNLTITDNGGFQRLSLTLHDKNFARIETVITRSILAARLANTIRPGETVEDKTGYFEFKVNSNSMINLRIRFGYSSSGDFIDDTTFDGSDFSGRLNNNKPVIRSPWIYFQMLNTSFNLTDFGMTVQIDAFSTADSFLSRAKLLKKFAIFRGTPENIIITLNTILVELSKETLTLVIDNGSEIKPLKNEDGTDTIDINLGGSPDGGVSFRTLRSVLNELVSKIPPRVYTADDVPIDTTDSTSVDKKIEKLSKIIPFTYYLEQKEEKGEIKSVIHFHYPDPIKNAGDQKKVRTYIWRENPLSIVKGLTIENRTDFASLNRQIVVRDGDKLKISVSASSETDEDGGERTTVLSPTDVTDALKNYDITFVSDPTSIDDGKNASLVIQQVINYLNQGVFNGAISLPGDPFYLFDTKLKPFQYVIRIVVMRPEYLDTDGSTVQETKSYLTGFYNVKTITHSINNSGFETTLNIMRWPG